VTSEVVPEQQLLPDNARAFLTAHPPRHATIATVNQDGGPHQIVIWYRFEPGNGDRGDRFIVNSRRGRRWPANLERERRASLAIFEGDDAVTVQVELVHLYEGEAALADIAEMARRYYEPEQAERDIAVFSTQERVTFVLRPVKAHIHGDPN
jgi:hypothetical protein